jgi:endonuclease YncB( thermonuclease family)
MVFACRHSGAMPRSAWSDQPILVALLLAPLLLTPACAVARPNATVVSVGDGDTIRVRQGNELVTVRLACIDAPETAQQPHGQQSRAYLQQRLPVGREVTLEVKTSDRYGRTVAEVISGTNINLLLVEAGQAFAYRQYLGGCDAKAYLDAEGRASRARLGVWQVEGGITRPWDFRQGRRYRCKEIGSYDRAQELLRQGHTYLDGNGDGEACKSLRRSTPPANRAMPSVLSEPIRP